jgi:hypothetical protein
LWAYWGVHHPRICEKRKEVNDPSSPQSIKIFFSEDVAGGIRNASMKINIRDGWMRGSTTRLEDEDEMSAGPKNRKREGESASLDRGGDKSKVFAFARSLARAVDLGPGSGCLSPLWAFGPTLATSFWRGISGIATLSELLF